MSTTWHDVQEKAQQFRKAEMTYWLNEVLFSSGWWILFISTIALLIIWILIVDKKRILEIITYGLMVSMIGLIGDIIGISLLLWEYPIALIHTPQLLEVHDIQMPIIYMAIYQYFQKWKSFFIAAAILAFVFGLILEPILVWLGIYEPYAWKPVYGLIPYFIIAVVLKWIVHQLKKLDHHYK